MKVEFRLNEFKQLAAQVDKLLPGWLAFLVKGWLYGLEERYIAAKASSAVSKAVREYNETVRTPEGLLPPERHTEPSEVEGLDTISITSPWKSQDPKTPTRSTHT